MSFLRESLSTFATRLLLVLANIPASILISRHLGPQGQGVYSLATTHAVTFVVIGLLGIDAAHTYYLASGRFRLSQVVGNSLVVLAVISVILVPIFPPLLAWVTRGRGGADLGPYLPFAAAAIPPVAARYLLLSVFMARKRLDRSIASHSARV